MLCPKDKVHLHINIQEFRKILLTFHAFQEGLLVYKVLLMSNNAIMVTCINKHKGTVSLFFCLLVRQVQASMVLHCKVGDQVYLEQKERNVQLAPFTGSSLRDRRVPLFYGLRKDVSSVEQTNGRYVGHTSQ